jgi:hypothetical protein
VALLPEVAVDQTALLPWNTTKLPSDLNNALKLQFWPGTLVDPTLLNPSLTANSVLLLAFTPGLVQTCPFQVQPIRPPAAHLSAVFKDVQDVGWGAAGRPGILQAAPSQLQPAAAQSLAFVRGVQNVG